MPQTRPSAMFREIRNEKSPLLEDVAREQLEKTAGWKKGLGVVVVICKVWRLATAL
jgi:hypothetical protein